MERKYINIIIYVLITLIVILLLYKVILTIKEKNNEKEIFFNIKTDSMKVKVGRSALIDYEKSNNLNILWESENSDIVFVNNGIVKGINLGNTTIKGTAIIGEKTITKTVSVSTYYGDENIALNDVILPDGELFITKGDSYNVPLEYSPFNGYITSIDYNIDDLNIVSYDNVILAKNTGTTNITITVNNNISKTIRVNVIDRKILPVFASKIKDINLNEEIITMKPNDIKKIEYSIEPSNGIIESINWESGNSNIIKVNDGIITAIKSGETTVKLTINERIIKTMDVIVSKEITNLILKSNPKLVMKVGDKSSIKALVMPSNASNTKLIYTSSNNSVSVNSNGVVTANSIGNGIITIKTSDGKKEVSISYVVNPRTGVINGTGGVWGYSSSIDQIPERADKVFFQQLVSSGKGTLSGNIYTYNDGKKTYKYDLSNNSLSSNGVSALARIYYPKGVDLSEVNTFTFGNGTGAAGWVNMLNTLDNNRSYMKTSGIIILIASKKGCCYDRSEFLLATEFVKSIVNQKAGVKNAVGGYSGSGEAAGYAANEGGYDRLIIFHSYVKSNPKLTPNLKNKEIIVYSPRNDKEEILSQTKTAIYHMVYNSFPNVTIISNNSGIINGNAGSILYKDKALIINPGNLMGSGHAFASTIPSSNLFSYACR